MPGSFFQRDRLVEQEISEFLDLYFYKTEVSNFKRYDDRKDQNDGIDVSFKHNGSEILVDEKSNSSPFYINKFIPTFAFEIKNTTSGKIGWFIDSTKKTDYYLMIYVFAEQPWKVPIVVERLHCFLLKRESLLNHLKSEGVTPESILLLTFTRKASEEMLKRATQTLDSRCNQISGGTFHSFANAILRQYANHIGFDNQFTILDQSDAQDLIQYMIK